MSKARGFEERLAYLYNKRKFEQETGVPVMGQSDYYYMPEKVLEETRKRKYAELESGKAKKFEAEIRKKEMKALKAAKKESPKKAKTVKGEVVDAPKAAPKAKSTGPGKRFGKPKK